MKLRKTEVRNMIASLAVIGVQVGLAGANVTVTGERTGSSPLPSLNLSHDLSQIAYASSRPAPIQFVDPSKLALGEVELAGKLDRSKYSPSIEKVCSPLLYLECGNPEISMWNSAPDFSLKLALYGGNAALGKSGGPSVGQYLNARRQMKDILEKDYGIDAYSASSPVNSRADSLKLVDLKIFADDAS
jgi:hypothetical protein